MNVLVRCIRIASVRTRSAAVSVYVLQATGWTIHYKNDKNGLCQNTFGSYICICPPGYRLDQTLQECVGKICKYGHCQNRNFLVRYVRTTSARTRSAVISVSGFQATG